MVVACLLFTFGLLNWEHYLTLPYELGLSTHYSHYRSTTQGQVVEGEGTDVVGMNHLVAVQVAGQVTFSLGISALVSSHCIQHTQ